MAAVAQRKSAPSKQIGADFGRIRDTTLALCSALEIEDCVVQSMPEASPIKWHLAHTTWFFEQFVLAKHCDEYREFDANFAYLFNSYYHGVGSQYPRADRGLVSRPTVAEVIRYRRYVDEAVQNLLCRRPHDAELERAVTLGLNHEQQHQELMLTDIKHAFSLNPSFPIYRPNITAALPVSDDSTAQPLQFVAVEGGLKWIGASEGAFCFDNEQPQHRILAESFTLANRLVTNSEYLEFIRSGGYRDPHFWLSDGWDAIERFRWSKPLYWQESLDSEFTLHGIAELEPAAPVCHISFYEADAFARWAQKRLPTEAEWEIAASSVPISGNFANSETYHPLPANVTDRLPVKQLFGDVWEWTASSYSPYPGYKTPVGAIGEYNGKFMSGRVVLRGGSCATPEDHIRATYRNFFDYTTRWQFAGVRLAQ